MLAKVAGQATTMQRTDVFAGALDYWQLHCILISALCTCRLVFDSDGLEYESAIQPIWKGLALRNYAMTLSHWMSSVSFYSVVCAFITDDDGTAPPWMLLKSCH